MGKGKELARQLKSQLGTNDPVHICELYHYHIFKAKLPRNTKGFYTKLYGSISIFVNDKLPPEHFRYICAHELGHALMHEEINVMHKDFQGDCEQMELEADEFAFWLLMEDKWMASYRLGRISVVQLSEITHMPMEVIERLQQKGIL